MASPDMREKPGNEAGMGGASEIEPKIVMLATIFPPYSVASGVIELIDPQPPEMIDQVTRHGYNIVTRVDDQAPYTHVISTGTNDYLAALEFAPDRETTL
jgi:hypothetical protein